ncbi:MAG: glycoside hydrolase family 28 protein [Prevotellaceae bacterium]|jgi:polygalacturonase|nr:glycoside hydrolase family 28 protein [Prevotellaceae bacterium]
MKRIFLSIAVALLAATVVFGQEIKQADVDEQLKNLPFASFSIKLPSFPDKTFNIVDAGAVGDGQFKNTVAINSTIEKCSKAGGGKVVIPAGLWLTGPITMQSNVNLYLAEGAIVIFSPDLNDYQLERTSSGKYQLPDLINGEGLENVAITGRGMFNGNGQYWRMVKKEKKTEKEWKALIKSGELTADGKIWYPRKGSLASEELIKANKASYTPEEEATIKISLRPYMLALRKCKNVLIEGITLGNAPKFAAYMNGHREVVFHDVKVRNEWWMQNADGLDISVCKNVLFYRCDVNTGDDGICMKSGNSKNGEFNHENIVVKDCKVYHGHGGFVIGSNTDGNMRNIFVDNCSFVGTHSGIRVKSGAGRGGKVTDIFCQNIYMKDIEGDAIVYELAYEDKGAVVNTDNKAEKIPDFDGFSIKNVFIDGAKVGVNIGGNAQSIVKNVTFQNMVIHAKEGFKTVLSENITVDNVRIISDVQPAFRLNKVNGFTFKNQKDVPEGFYIKVLGEQSKNISIENSAIKASQVELLDNLKPDILKIK